MASGDHHRPAPALLTSNDPSPVSIVNPDGSSPFLFIGDHAGNVIPSSLGSLGLSVDELTRHIAWDIGVGALGELLAERMDAVFIRQSYSRLVVDCNRQPTAFDAIALISDGTPISGNQELTDREKQQRVDEIHEPYHQAIADQLDRRQRNGRSTIIIALHSFTPALKDGGQRPWQIGILHDRGNAAFALTLMEKLRGSTDLIVGDNEPYRMDLVDYTVPRHAYPANLPYAEIEIRQDILRKDDDLRSWRDRMSNVLTAAAAV